LGIRQQYPYWVKDPSMGLRTINAKAETITTAPAFRESFKYRRSRACGCLYEWQKLDVKTKQESHSLADGSRHSILCWLRPCSGCWPSPAWRRTPQLGLVPPRRELNSSRVPHPDPELVEGEGWDTT
jgi:hypothetical protein